MNSRLNKQIEPVCKFGPGGDFISVWPSQPVKIPLPSPNRLAGLLNIISEIINATLGTELDPATATSISTHTTANQMLWRREKEYAAKNTGTEKSVNSTPTTVIKGPRLLSAEPMLFADDCRIVIRTGHKPKHRIRAYRRTAKKTPAPVLPGQGSLFETNFRNAKTA